MELEGGTAIVTGAGGGLGRLLAEGFARAGMSIVIADVDPEGADGTARLVRACGASARTVLGDVRDPSDAERIVSAARRAATGDRGRADDGPLVLVNNAGGWSPRAQFPDASPGAWSATLDLNLHAPMLLTQLALPAMRERGGGAVVNIASSAALGDGAYGSPEYGAAKAGLIRFTTAVRGLDESHGVRVTCLVPDWIGLDRAIAQWDALPEEERAALPPLIPPAEVVDVALELARDGSPGAVVEMHGGQPPVRRGERG